MIPESPSGTAAPDPIFSSLHPMKTTLLALSLLTLAFAGIGLAVEVDQLGPTVKIVTPAIGTLPAEEKVVVSGTVSDNAQTGATAKGIGVLQYRYSGSKKWRNAMIIPGKSTAAVPEVKNADGTVKTPGVAATTGDGTFAFSIKLAKGETKSVSVRGKDKGGNIGDTITLRIKRSRTGA
jgi:hypothetical protein